MVLLAAAAILAACGQTDLNRGRVLTAISVSPETADAQNFSHGQVMFTATGSFNIPPLSAQLTFSVPYSGQFAVQNPPPPANPIANIVSTGSGTITVECATGATGAVSITATASANDAFGTVVTGNAQLTCP